MNAARYVLVMLAVLAFGVALILLFGSPVVFAPLDTTYERTTVHVVEADVSIDVRVADTAHKRYLGLSDTDSLDDGEGMLFVHDTEGEYTYVMRDMDFPLDVIFIDAEGRITVIHHAPLPPDGRYNGTGKYVLEVPYGYTNRTDITVGDRVEIEGY